MKNVIKLAAIIAAAFCCFKIIRLQNDKINQKYRVVTQVNEIDDEKEKLNQQLENIENDYQTQTTGKAGISLIVNQTDSSVISYIYPILKNNDYRAVLALDQNYFPNEEDAITSDDFDMLMNDGWSYCIRWDGRGEFNEFMTELIEKFNEAGIKVPQTLLVSRGYYSDEVANTAVEFGIKNIIHHGEGDREIVSTYTGANCWEIGAVSYMDTSVSTLLDSAVETGGVLVMSIDYYNDVNMNSLMKKLKEYEEKEKIMVDTIGNVKKYKKDLNKNQDELDQKYQEDTNQVKEELEKLDKEREEQSTSIN